MTWFSTYMMHEHARFMRVRGTVTCVLHVYRLMSHGLIRGGENVRASFF